MKKGYAVTAVLGLCVLLSSFTLFGKNTGSSYYIGGKLVQPEIGVRSVTVLKKDNLSFKDSNGNKKLDPYEDWRLSPAERAADLAKRMTPAERIGLLGEYMWGGFSAGGIQPKNEEAELGIHEIEAIVKEHSRYTLLRWPAANISAKAIARKVNNLQALAESEPHGIPVLITTDPIFSAANNMGSTALEHQNMAPQIPDWPLVLGLGAINDPAYVKEIGKMQAAQLRALGIRWMLGPQADFATEPMWSRVYDTFGSDPKRVASLATAYIQGLQGLDKGVDPFNGIVTTMKHFPGAGADENGMDSHNAFGKSNIFPGKNFDAHLAIMKAVIQNSNPLSIMPNYSIFEGVSVKGKPVEQINAHYSAVLMQDVLRKEFGWNGMVTSDWTAIALNKADGTAGQAWGTETWTNGARVKRYFENGGHQIGLGSNPTSIWQAGLDEGTLTQDNIISAAQKVLEITFAVGLFENPYVNPETAEAEVKKYEASAHEAMMRAFTLLKNGDGTIQVYYDGLNDGAIDGYAAKVANFKAVKNIADADYAIVRVSARHGIYFGLDGGVPLGYRDPVLVYDQKTDAPSNVVSTLKSRDGDGKANTEASIKIAETIEKAIEAKKTNPKLKIILVVSMYRPFIIADYIDNIDVVAADFGMTDNALLDMVFQMKNGVKDASVMPRGTLPMEIPSSQKAVYDSAEDLPDDSVNPTFKAGSGLTSY